MGQKSKIHNNSCQVFHETQPTNMIVERTKYAVLCGPQRTSNSDPKTRLNLTQSSYGITIKHCVFKSATKVQRIFSFWKWLGTKAFSTPPERIAASRSSAHDRKKMPWMKSIQLDTNTIYIYIHIYIYVYVWCRYVYIYICGVYIYILLYMVCIYIYQ